MGKLNQAQRNWLTRIVIYLTEELNIEIGDNFKAQHGWLKFD